MATSDILVIGAGATGLYAAMELGRAGHRVTILEARDRAGGRMHTIHDPAFDLPVELGAEFVHGDLEITTKLLREANIEYYPVRGRMWRSINGKLEKQAEMLEDEKDLISQLKTLEEDISVQKFLDTYFPGERYAELRITLTDFVQGYDAADIADASCFSLLEELLGEEGSEQYRIKGGYTKLTEYLVNECKKAGCDLKLSTIVSSIDWQEGNVMASASNNKTFSASKAIITLPLSVLKATRSNNAFMEIKPMPQDKRDAIRRLGITGVIKVLVQFNKAFWKDAQYGVSDIGFVFSKAAIPTWWTQLPEDNCMLTGWLGGPPAVQWKHLTEKEILQRALQSLSQIFSIDVSTIESQLKAHHIANWTADEFTLGAYGYEGVESKQAKRIMNTPLQNTLYFAGEAVNEGPDHGTVEGAFQSAKFVVSQVLQ